MPQKHQIIVMGVSGSGKSTTAVALANVLQGVFLEGDDYHPAENVKKMASGTPLQDSDRWHWLNHLATEITEHGSKGSVVASCSALKRSYRERLRSICQDNLLFVYLHLSEDALTRRFKNRTGHFMPASLLQSQLDTLEPPLDEAKVISVDGELSTEEQVAQILLDIEQLDLESNI